MDECWKVALSMELDIFTATTLICREWNQEILQTHMVLNFQPQHRATWQCVILALFLILKGPKCTKLISWCFTWHKTTLNLSEKCTKVSGNTVTKEAIMFGVAFQTWKLDFFIYMLCLVSRSFNGDLMKPVWPEKHLLFHYERRDMSFCRWQTTQRRRCSVCVLADITCEFKEFLFCPVMPLFGPVLKT